MWRCSVLRGAWACRQMGILADSDAGEGLHGVGGHLSSIYLDLKWSMAWL